MLPFPPSPFFPLACPIRRIHFGHRHRHRASRSRFPCRWFGTCAFPAGRPITVCGRGSGLRAALPFWAARRNCAACRSRWRNTGWATLLRLRSLSRDRCGKKKGGRERVGGKKCWESWPSDLPLPDPPDHICGENSWAWARAACWRTSLGFWPPTATSLCLSCTAPTFLAPSLGPPGALCGLLSLLSLAPLSSLRSLWLLLPVCLQGMFAFPLLVTFLRRPHHSSLGREAPGEGFLPCGWRPTRNHKSGSSTLRKRPSWRVLCPLALPRCWPKCCRSWTATPSPSSSRTRWPRLRGPFHRPQALRPPWRGRRLLPLSPARGRRRRSAASGRGKGSRSRMSANGWTL